MKTIRTIGLQADTTANNMILHLILISVLALVAMIDRNEAVRLLAILAVFSAVIFLKICGDLDSTVGSRGYSFRILRARSPRTFAVMEASAFVIFSIATGKLIASAVLWNI